MSLTLLGGAVVDPIAKANPVPEPVFLRPRSVREQTKFDLLAGPNNRTVVGQMQPRTSSRARLDAKLADLTTEPWFQRIPTFEYRKQRLQQDHIFAQVDTVNGHIESGFFHAQLPLPYRQAFIEMLSDPIVQLAIRKGTVDQISWAKANDDNGYYSPLTHQIVFMATGIGLRSGLYKNALDMTLVGEHEAAHAINNEWFGISSQDPESPPPAAYSDLHDRLFEKCNQLIAVPYVRNVTTARQAIADEFERLARTSENVAIFGEETELRSDHLLTAKLFRRIAEAFLNQDPRTHIPDVGGQCMIFYKQQHGVALYRK